MTRRVFGEQPVWPGQDPSATVKAYLAPSGGSAVDVADSNGDVLTDGIITLSSDQVPEFQGPDDGTSVLFLERTRDPGNRLTVHATDSLPDPGASQGAPLTKPKFAAVQTASATIAQGNSGVTIDWTAATVTQGSDYYGTDYTSDIVGLNPDVGVLKVPCDPGDTFEGNYQFAASVDTGQNGKLVGLHISHGDFLTDAWAPVIAGQVHINVSADDGMLGGTAGERWWSVTVDTSQITADLTSASLYVVIRERGITSAPA